MLTKLVQRLLPLVSRLEKFPSIMRFSPEFNLIGLENIELALPTDVFFTIFGVTVPPFPTEVCFSSHASSVWGVCKVHMLTVLCRIPSFTVKSTMELESFSCILVH